MMPAAFYKAVNGSPFELARFLWPKVQFYREQKELIQSVEENDETFCVAGNMLGKDFTAGFIALSFFLRHGPCRVVTTSVKDDHLRVLWGEIGRFIDTAVVPLDSKRGGPLVINHRDLRRVDNDGTVDKISYCRGMVSERGEGMAGHHAAWTLGIIDEASGVDDLVYTQLGTWARRLLIFGNANPPVGGPSHFFQRNVEAGDLLAS